MSDETNEKTETAAATEVTATGTAGMSARVDAALSEPPPALADAVPAAGPIAELITAGQSEVRTAAALLDIVSAAAADATATSTPTPEQLASVQMSVLHGSFDGITSAIEQLRVQLDAAQSQDYKPLIYAAIQRLEGVRANVNQAFAPAE